jgi:outer membrane protein assembly factor BamB
MWGGSNGATIDSAGASALGFTNSDLAWDRDHTGMLMVMEATLANSFFGGLGGGSSSAQTWLVAMNPADGSVPWKYAMPKFTTPTSPGITGGIFSADFGNAAPAVADDGTVYVGNGDGLYAFSFTGTGSSTVGTLKAGFPFSAADVDSAPAIGGDGTVFFGCADGTFYAVRPDGSLRFKIVTSGRISSAPAIGPDGTVFFVSDEGNLYAVR